MPALLTAALLCLLLAASPVLASPERADLLLKQGDPGAAQVIEALAKARPGDPDVGVLQLRLLLQKREAKRALELAEKLVRQTPGHAASHYWMGMAYGARIGQVGAFSQATMAPKVRAAFERAVELDPSLHDARFALMEYYLRAPGIVGGSESKARAQAEELLRRDPPRGRFAQARLAMHDGNDAEARRQVLAAYAARPGEAMFRMAAGALHQQAEEWDQAFAVFTAWAADEPWSASAWYQIGRTAVLSEQRTEEGIAAFERVLALNPQPGAPEHKHAWYRLGQLHAQAGDKAAARQAFERALALDPDLEDARKAMSAL
ncbi:MAG: hypothetical protein ABS41_07860 [Arenimonas sp. SCN 70-307]|uniref:tetratricopeptide repeat protein n=1 Tax=Arenimonas sp. SCN 70-307 TaxID=1660089 RepID=UPI00086DC4A6|nr:tetratricopeptide repeat protein [Arenimonas sp. SCN 70-307]ODS63076.1 MAG: hypothetical protein ABS41_07860 [Arenimonas sp. SCN 70-307]